MTQLQTISVLRRGALPSDQLAFETGFDIEIPFPWSHISVSPAAQELMPGLVELYFDVGSKEDAVANVGGAVEEFGSPDNTASPVAGQKLSDEHSPSVRYVRRQPAAES